MPYHGALLRKTKIVCTIGPSCRDAGSLERLVLAGMNVARLNFSHGTHQEHSEVIDIIKEIRTRLNRPVAILQDLCGPKIRVGTTLEGGISLKPDDMLTFIDGDTGVPGDATGLRVNYPNLSDEIHVGDRIMLADGAIEVRVTAKEKGRTTCQVITGGRLTSHKGLNLPDTSLKTPAVTPKDLDDLTFGLSRGVDLVALSFVRRREDIFPIKKLFQQMGCRTPIIAKIEMREALDNLSEILDEVDGVMVARGDLGVEIPIEEVTLVQKKIISQANYLGKPVITATQMLKSMVDSPRPTRAEAADVTNAIIDGTDAVMLSEETASGHYPLEAVELMHRLCLATEKALDYKAIFLAKEVSYFKENETNITDAISHAACLMARNLGAPLIIVSTASGYTAAMISRFRPQAPVLALTDSRTTSLDLALCWGVEPCIIEQVTGLDAMFQAAEKYIRDHELATSGQTVVVTAGAPLGSHGTTNLVRLMQIH
ncbi:MAG: pyruvate kinase [Deltaproteobacteria bacterium]|nr:pyruvate kinase [Deltaproteobacteria bacterium]